MLFSLMAALANGQSCDYCRIDTLVHEEMNCIFGYENCVMEFPNYRCTSALGYANYVVGNECEPVQFIVGPNADDIEILTVSDAEKCDAIEVLLKGLNEKLGSTGCARFNDEPSESDCDYEELEEQLKNEIHKYTNYLTCTEYPPDPDENLGGMYACENSLVCIRYETKLDPPKEPDVLWTANGNCNSADLTMKELGGQPCNALFVVENELRQQLATNYDAVSKGNSDADVDVTVDSQDSAATAVFSVVFATTIALAFATIVLL